MLRLLFVCTGNTCRSPMAAAAMAESLALHRPELAARCCSAGLYAREGDPVSPLAVAALREAGLAPLCGHARALAPSMLREADLVFALSQGHRRELVRRWPQFGDKVRLLTPGGVPDPYGGTLAEYRRCLQKIADAVEGIVLSLSWEGEITEEKAKKDMD